MSLPTAPSNYRYLLPWLQDSDEARRQFKNWMLKRRSKRRLYKDRSALLPFPQNTSGGKTGAEQLPTITVTTPEGRTLFLHENMEFRNMVRRGWTRMKLPV